MDASCIAYEQKGRDLIAKLGVCEVGMASRLFRDGYPWGAQWRCYLPGLAVAPRPATDLDEAKRQLEQTIMSWIDAAQLAPAAERETPIRAFRQGQGAST